MLDENWSGSQRAIFELTRAMAAVRPDQPFSVLVGPAGAASIGDAFADFRHVTLDVHGNRAADWAWRYDLTLRGMQFHRRAELDWVSRISTAFVVRHLDFITQVRSAYSPSTEAFEELCAASDQALRKAAGVIWVSHSTARHAKHLGVPQSSPVRAVVSEGLDHEDEPVAPVRPAGLPDDRPFLLQLGNAFEHKNRLFSMRAAGRLHAEGWPGRLVLAGAYPTWGGSQDLEQALRAADPHVDAAVVDLGHVSDAERAWLVDHAVLGLFPSAIEGFGLVPFEFARRGVATVSSRCFSLGELQPPTFRTSVTLWISTLRWRRSVNWSTTRRNGPGSPPGSPRSVAGSRGSVRRAPPGQSSRRRLRLAGPGAPWSGGSPTLRRRFPAGRSSPRRGVGGRCWCARRSRASAPPAERWVRPSAACQR